MKDERPQATAWFPPFPPAETVKDVAVRVSPAAGQRGVVVTKSMFREPMMQMWGLVVLILTNGLFVFGFGLGINRNVGRGVC